MTELELLAPARNVDIGIAAIRCGADAVYIGGPSFGARAAAGNSIEDISRLCREAGPFGVKIFVTVNTLARNDAERKEAVEMMCSMRGIGISAFIIQDCSLLPLLAAQGPWKEQFHASTQCAIRTPERAVQLAELGFARLILERELSLEEIKAIREAVPSEVELECFVHGALCVCYSGDCYLSEYLTGRSANRGECAQPCRNMYDLVDKDGKVLVGNKPLLSLKDLKLIGRIPALVQAGVVSFKIEGRLKNESYVKNVVSAYSMALDAFIAAHPDEYRRRSYGRSCTEFTPDLDKTFNRGYTSLYLDGKRGRWLSGEAAKGMGELLGTVKKEGYPANGQKSHFIELDDAAPQVHNGDGLCCVTQNGEVAGFRADRVEGRRILCKKVDGIAEGCRIWRNLDTDFEKKMGAKSPERYMEAGLDVHVSEDTVRVGATAENGIRFSGEFTLEDPLVKADNQDRMQQMISGQLGKTAGIFSFHVNSVSSDGALPLIPSGKLNAIRRSLAEKALEAIAAQESQTGDNGPAQTGIHYTSGLAEGNLDGLSHPRREGELMRSRYCILHELGKCLKTPQGRAFAKNGLFLRNNGSLIPLHFDCKNCEMVLQVNGLCVNFAV